MFVSVYMGIRLYKVAISRTSQHTHAGGIHQIKYILEIVFGRGIANKCSVVFYYNGFGVGSIERIR